MHAAALGAAPRLVHQPARAQLVELLLPGVERVLGEADQRGEIARRQAAPLPGVEDQQPLLGRHRRLGRLLRLDQPPALGLARADQTGPADLLEGLLGERLFVRRRLRRPGTGLAQRPSLERCRGGWAELSAAGGTTWGPSTAGAGVGPPAPPKTLAASLGLRPRSAASVFSLALALSQTCLTPLRSNRCWRGNYSTSLSHFLVENFGADRAR